MGLPVSTGYQWSVYGFSPFADIDAAAGTDGFLGVLIGSVSGDAAVGISAARTFTTAP
jgi:hypothetical protein